LRNMAIFVEKLNSYRIVNFGFLGAFVFQSAFRNLQSAIAMARPGHETEAAS